MNTLKRNSHTRTKLFANRVPWPVRAAGATLMAACVFLTAPSVQADLLTYYNFNDGPTSGQTANTALLTSDGGLQTTTITTNFPVGAAGATNTGAGSVGGSTVNQLASDTTGAGLSLALIGGTGATGTAGAGTGGNNGEYIQFTLSTTNYQNLVLSYATQKTSTGFANQQLLYSTNGTTFTSFGTATSIPTAFATQTFDLSSVAALTNQSNVTLRLVFTGASSSSGNNRIDNLQVNASSFVSGTSPNYFGTTGTGYNASSTVFDTTTADFNTANDGTGTAKVFDPSQTGVFSGTSGTVTVSTVTANGGIRFGSNGYVFNGGTLTLGTTPTVEVTNATDTATVNTTLAGTTGLTKTGAGTLVLGGTANNFSGGVAINGGTLSVSSDANLGATSNNITLAGGTLLTTAGFTSARGLSGTGSVNVANATTLGLSGTVATTALTVAGTGTLDLRGTTPSVGTLTFAAAGTLASSTSSTVSFTGLTAPNLTGTATVSAALTSAATATIATVVGTGGDLILSSTVATTGLTGNSSLSKTGAGTLELDGANIGLYRVQLGSASASATTTGGTLVINNQNALGTNQFFMNSGTLSATADLTGGSALPIGVSLGGLAGSTTGNVAYVPTVFAGSNIEFAGGTGIYETTGLTNSVTVNNTTTLSGVVSTTNPTVAGGTIAKGNGFIVTSTNNGTLILSGSSPNTFTDALTIGGSATIVAAKATALGASIGVTINTGGTLLLGGTATGRIGTVPITLAGGKFATGGNSDSAGALTLSGTSSIDFGVGSTNSVLTFADSSGKTWTAVVTLLNYTDQADAINFGTSATTGTGGGLTASQLNDIQYTSGGTLYAGVGFDAMGDVTFGAVPEPTTVLGGVLLTVAAGWTQRRRLRAAFAA